ncbi:MAG: M81 family metallopeptidase [Proteobacteria bacterium]|nr:M81 family metallopeptidase [Pseudomonadota bacterium]
MRIAIAGFALESVSFLPHLTGMADFERWALRGPAMIEGLRGEQSPGGGFVDTLEAAGAEIVPLVYTDGFAAGSATDEAFEAFRDEIATGLTAVRDDIDGVLLFLHGAMTTPTRTNPDLECLRAVRAAVGNDVPVMLALDLHANLAPETTTLANALFGFHYSPHTDMAETGARAADCLLRTLRGEVRPVAALVKPALTLPSIFTATSVAPLKDIVAEGFAAERSDPRIIDISIFCGFAYADVPQLGFSVAVVTDNDPALARRTAETLAARIDGAREALQHKDRVLGIGAGVDRAMAVAAQADRPVVILEHADRMNDSTWTLRELMRRKVRHVAVPYLWDPAAARAAVETGTGNAISIDVGGHSSDRTGGPVRLVGRVLFAGPKRFIGTGPMRKGRDIDLGLAAVIEADGITVILTEHTTPAIDLDPFIQFGLDAADFDIIVLRSKTHFRAVYEAFSAEIIIIDTPDWGPADLTTLPYRNVRPGVFPVTT